MDTRHHLIEIFIVFLDILKSLLDAKQLFIAQESIVWQVNLCLQNQSTRLGIKAPG